MIIIDEMLITVLGTWNALSKVSTPVMIISQFSNCSIF
jgi:hypothetical protein